MTPGGEETFDSGGPQRSQGLPPTLGRPALPEREPRSWGKGWGVRADASRSRKARSLCCPCPGHSCQRTSFKPQATATLGHSSVSGACFLLAPRPPTKPKAKVTAISEHTGWFWRVPRSLVLGTQPEPRAGQFRAGPPRPTPRAPGTSADTLDRRDHEEPESPSQPHPLLLLVHSWG